MDLGLNGNAQLLPAVAEASVSSARLRLHEREFMSVSLPEPVPICLELRFTWMAANAALHHKDNRIRMDEIPLSNVEPIN